jgi:hypothetical protein
VAGRVLLVALIALMTTACLVTGTSSGGISYPSGPSLAQFGLRDRCPQGGDCTQHATDAVKAALTQLGAIVEDPPVTTTGVAPLPDRLLIDVDSDPPFSWRAENGAEGESVAVRVDLTDAIAYVVVAPDTAFRLRDEDAAAIRDALFIRR